MTIKQKQCLLEYLGYYDPENSKEVNNVDGRFGPASKAATRRFQSDYGLEVDGSFGPLTQAKALEAVAGKAQKVTVDWDKVKYFRRDEFKCKCKGKYCDGFPCEPDPRLVAAADQVREHFGSSARVSSGVRCETHNANVGGVPHSRHKLGKAMDFMVSGFSAETVLAYVQSLPQIRYAYAIDSNYVHMDVE